MTDLTKLNPGDPEKGERAKAVEEFAAWSGSSDLERFAFLSGWDAALAAKAGGKA